MSVHVRPLDEANWPDKLTAHVVTPGARAAIHGYDVEGDLALHYSFSESVLLAWTGELPTPAQARAFNVALQFASPAPVNEAPGHAALLARICAGTTSSIQGVAAIGLAEQARSVVADQREWIERLAEVGPLAVPPEAQRARSDEERASVLRLRRALRGTIEVPALTHDIGRAAAIVATFSACGLKRAEHVECALVLAKLPVVMAEALAIPEGNYRDYPVLLPPISYQEDVP